MSVPPAIRTEPVMGTLVTIQIVRSNEETEAALDRAFGWFHEIEERCTRFQESSELMQLASHVGRSPNPALTCRAFMEGWDFLRLGHFAPRRHPGCRRYRRRKNPLGHDRTVPHAILLLGNR